MHKHGTEPTVDGKRRSAQLLRMLGLLLLVSRPEAGHAQQAPPELPTEPILRVESGLHGQYVNSIDTDAANKFAVTASSDKTVRVWSLPDGRPQGVLRLPIDYGKIGQAFAVAISPDGTTIAAGGWTGLASHHNIFLFDRVSGALKQRLPDLPGLVEHLAFSADGQRLAASLSSGGIRVFDASKDYRLLPSDSAYGNVSYWAHFDRAGRLVTASYDRMVRLYAADQYATPVAQFEWKGHRPRSAVFSVDGARVAVGDADSPDVVVLSGSGLTELFLADTSGIPRDVSLGKVSWSQDGSSLFAGGTWTANTLIQVRRWSYGGGPKAYVDIPVGSGSVQLVALKSGSILAAHDSGLVLIAADSKVTQLQGLGRLDLRSTRGRVLRVSADGSTVQIDAWLPRHSYGFALADRRVQIDPVAVDAANCLYVFCREALQEPVTQVPGLDITNWYSSKKPVVNGTPIKLRPDERSFGVAIVPGTQHFVLGADFSLRLLDQRGEDVWSSVPEISRVTWHVNVTASGRMAVAGYGDGTIRWHRLSDGKELLALSIHPDGQRWVAWTPQGYYDASLGADELIGWHINHGYDRAPDFYPVSQFRDRFYRPDVIQRVLQTPNLDVDEAVRDADLAARRPTKKAATVSSLLTPVVKVHSTDPTAVDRTDLQLAYSVQLPSATDALRVEVLIDGVKTPAVDQPLVATGGIRAGMLKLSVPRRDSVVSILASNGAGAGEPASIHVQWRGPGTDPKLTLYVLAIGVGKYRDKNVPPLLAGKDADDFVALVKKQEGGLYEKVITHPPSGSLRDAAATKEAILDELDWIRSAVTNTNNVAMVFLSGHGVMTPDQHYRFLPHDYDPQHVERTTISDYELADYLTKIGGKKLFFFDTCHSGAVLGGKAPDTAPNVDKFANELKAAENGVVVFTSSTGTELSQEGDGNSVFTQAVVEGLGGKAGRPEIPVITITDLNGYVSRRVKDLTKGNQKPMMAMPKTVEDFPISVRLQ
jgi:WD40 repeat protein